jgi:hypothetical protein
VNGTRAAPAAATCVCSDEQNLRIVSDVKGFRVGDRSRGRFATPADCPLHAGTPYRGLHVVPLIAGYTCDVGFGICPSYKDHSLSRRANPSVTILNFFIAVCHPRGCWA